MGPAASPVRPSSRSSRPRRWSRGIATDWHTDVTSEQNIEGCGDYRPRNYDGSAGVEDMSSALAESNNVFHVKLGQFVGLEDVVGFAEQMGLDNGELPAACSLPLGSGSVFAVDLAEAYATFANDGVRCTPTFVTEVLDGAGNVLLTRRAPDCNRVIESSTAQQVTTMLRGVVDGGTGRRAGIGVPVAAKTGTTSNNFDAWLAGYSGYLTTVTWVGHEIPREMPGVSGGNVPALIFNAFMAPLIQDAGLASVDVRRYRMPECPAPPPPPEPTPSPTEGDGQGGDGEGGAGQGGAGGGDDGTADQTASLAQAEPSDGATGEAGERPFVNTGEFAGFDPVANTIQSGLDGDSFLDGIQPEPCTRVAEPEALPPAATGAGADRDGDRDGHRDRDRDGDGDGHRDRVRDPRRRPRRRPASRNRPRRRAAASPPRPTSRPQPVEPTDDVTQSANPTDGPPPDEPTEGDG